MPGLLYVLEFCSLRMIEPFDHVLSAVFPFNLKLLWSRPDFTTRPEAKIPPASSSGSCTQHHSLSLQLHLLRFKGAKDSVLAPLQKPVVKLELDKAAKDLWKPPNMVLMESWQIKDRMLSYVWSSDTQWIICKYKYSSCNVWGYTYAKNQFVIYL